MSVIKKQMMIGEDEYLAGEVISDIKHELIGGQVYAMAGAGFNHDLISGNLYSEFRAHVRKSPCTPFTSDMRVRVGTNYYYPDVSVDCEFDISQPNHSDTPVIIVEVLSQSTRRNDQTTKRLTYINIPSLQEYVLVEQDFVQVEVARRSNGWLPSHYFLGDDVTFESIGLTLPVEEIYHSVQNEQMIEFLKTAKSET